MRVVLKRAANPMQQRSCCSFLEKGSEVDVSEGEPMDFLNAGNAMSTSILYPTQNDAMGGKEGGIGWGNESQKSGHQPSSEAMQKGFFLLPLQKVKRAGEFR